jgi:hypothetical protein
VTVTAVGIVKVTRRVLPTAVATANALVLALGRLPGVPGARLTVTANGRMGSAGKLEPVTSIRWMPGWPSLGEVIGTSVTVDLAQLVRKTSRRHPKRMCARQWSRRRQTLICPFRAREPIKLE